MTPSLTTTAPTAGLGQVRPSPRRPSVSASCMKRGRPLWPSQRSRKLVFQDAEDHLRTRRSTFVIAGEFAEHGLEILGLAEIAIDRGEAHIGDIIELAQMLHHDLADRLGRQSGSPPLSSSRTIAETSFSMRSGSTGRFRKPICSERTSLSRSNGTRRPLRLMTVSSRSCTRSKVVKRGLQAMQPPPPDHGRIFSRPGILDLRIEAVAARAAHSAALY